MTQNFLSTMEQGVVAPFVPVQKRDEATPKRCAKLAEMSFSELLYYMVVSEQKAAA